MVMLFHRDGGFKGVGSDVTLFICLTYFILRSGRVFGVGWVYERRTASRCLGVCLMITIYTVFCRRVCPCSVLFCRLLAGFFEDLVNFSKTEGEHSKEINKGVYNSPCISLIFQRSISVDRHRDK